MTLYVQTAENKPQRRQKFVTAYAVIWCSMHGSISYSCSPHRTSVLTIFITNLFIHCSLIYCAHQFILTNYHYKVRHVMYMSMQFIFTCTIPMGH